MKRYDSDRDGAMDEYEDGGYVRYEDAAELQRQLGEVTRERDALRLIVKFADARINNMRVERRATRRPK